MRSERNKYTLAIDLGTSALKVALFTVEGEAVGFESVPMRVNLFPNGGAEQDTTEWWTGFLSAAQCLLRKHTALLDDVVGVCCTTQWSGTVPVDGAGHPLCRAIIWMDSRGARYAKQISGGWPSLQGYSARKLWTWVRLTGGAPAHSGKDSLAHILFLKHERPEIYARADKFLEPKDYFNLCLTGLCAASFESITLHWVTDNRDISKIAYDRRLLRLAGIERAKLPALKRAGDILGSLKPELARDLGLPENTPVVMGTPDVHSAAIGSGAVRDFDSHLYLGTSSWLTCHVPFKKTDLTHNMASLPSAIPNRYLIANDQESAGACLAYLRDRVFFPQEELGNAEPPHAYRAMDELASRVPAGSDKLIFMPWLYGERTPVEDRRLRGGFFNQSLATTRAHLSRAVLEGVAYNSRWLLGAVENFAGRQLPSLNMIGGGASSKLWCQIHADVLGRTIRQIQDPVLANARGAAFLASVALGHLRFNDVPSRVVVAHTYEPNPANRHIYDELFREFLNLYRRNRDIFARLNR